MNSIEEKKHKYIIGIDPGRSTGVCLYDPKQKDANRIVMLKTFTFWGFIEFLEKFLSEKSGGMFDNGIREVEIIIEDPQLNPSLFAKRSKLSHAVQVSAAQDIGRNKEQAFLLMEYFDRKGIKYRSVKPNPRSPKWTAKTFKFYTKSELSSNEHTRDAVKLVWGL